MNANDLLQATLRPCPFCGGRAKLENSRMPVKGEKVQCAYIVCLECRARGKKVPVTKYGKTSHSYRANKEAADHWNIRKSDEIF